jgi:hypothetical protein
MLLCFTLILISLPTGFTFPQSYSDALVGTVGSKIFAGLSSTFYFVEGYINDATEVWDGNSFNRVPFSRKKFSKIVYEDKIIEILD